MVKYKKLCAPQAIFWIPNVLKHSKEGFKLHSATLIKKRRINLANFVHHFSVLPQRIKFTARIKQCGTKINITGCEDYEKTFAQIESDCTLRFGWTCKVLMKSISYTKQSNLFLHFLSASKRFSRTWGIVPFTFFQCLAMAEDCCLGPVTRLCKCPRV